MTTGSAAILVQELKGDYSVSIARRNGLPEGVGRALLLRYNDLFSARDLVRFGDMRELDRAGDPVAPDWSAVADGRRIRGRLPRIVEEADRIWQVEWIYLRRMNEPDWLVSRVTIDGNDAQWFTLQRALELRDPDNWQFPA